MKNSRRFIWISSLTWLALGLSSCVTYSNGARSYEEHVMKVLDTQEADLFQCGNQIPTRGLKRGESIDSQIEFRFQISPDGRVVASPEYNFTPQKYPNVENCLNQKLYAMRFDSPQGRITGAQMTYRLRFRYTLQ